VAINAEDSHINTAGARVCLFHATCVAIHHVFSAGSFTPPRRSCSAYLGAAGRRSGVSRVRPPFNLELHRQGFDSPEDRVLLPIQILARQAQLGEAVQDGVEGDAGFQPHERRSDAEMDA